MRITEKEILFDKPLRFQDFVRDLELIGQIRFSRPVVDNSGSIMIREKIFVKQSLIEKLTEMSDQYALPIAVEATSDLLTKIRLHLTNAIQKHIDSPGNAFLYRLYANLSRNHRPYILHAFADRTLTMLAYRLLIEKREFFEHISILGLMNLGIVLQQNLNVPLVHRHAFLAGFTGMIGLADSDSWRYTPEEDAERKRRLERGAALIDRLEIVEGLGNVVRDSYLPFAKPQVVEDQFGGLLGDIVDGRDAPAELVNASGVEAESENEDGGESVHPEAAPIIAESLRLARFAYEQLVNSPDRITAVRELIHQIAYNSGKGYFSKRLVAGTIQRFSEYEADVKYLEKLAAVESKCLHGGHAWAYPKPRATQVLCSGNVHLCPYYRGGWSFHLVAPQNAYGRIGENLPPGTYDKCELEDELPPEPKPIPQPKKNKSVIHAGETEIQDVSESPPQSAVG